MKKEGQKHKYTLLYHDSLNLTPTSRTDTVKRVLP